MWDVPTNELYSEDYHTRFESAICNVDGNPKYNMMACVGFGHEYPVMVFYYEKTRKEIDFSLGRNYIEEEEELIMEEKERNQKL